MTKDDDRELRGSFVFTIRPAYSTLTLSPLEDSGNGEKKSWTCSISSRSVSNNFISILLNNAATVTYNSEYARLYAGRVRRAKDERSEYLLNTQTRPRTASKWLKISFQTPTLARLHPSFGDERPWEWEE